MIIIIWQIVFTEKSCQATELGQQQNTAELEYFWLDNNPN